MEGQVKDRADAGSSTAKPGKPSSTAPEAVLLRAVGVRVWVLMRKVPGACPWRMPCSKQCPR